MRISRLLWRHGNDFHFEAECDCGRTSQWGDGYADRYYQVEVFPNRPCPHCELTEMDYLRRASSEAPGS